MLANYSDYLTAEGEVQQKFTYATAPSHSNASAAGSGNKCSVDEKSRVDDAEIEDVMHTVDIDAMKTNIGRNNQGFLLQEEDEEDEEEEREGGQEGEDEEEENEAKEIGTHTGMRDGVLHSENVAQNGSPDYSSDE